MWTEGYKIIIKEERSKNINGKDMKKEWKKKMSYFTNDLPVTTSGIHTFLRENPQIVKQTNIKRELQNVICCHNYVESD
jgi:hypothetical protein